MVYVLVAIAVIAAFVAGTFEGPTVEKWIKSWSAARALKAAQAVIAKAEADAKALAAAKATVAAAPVTGVTGPTGG